MQLEVQIQDLFKGRKEGGSAACSGTNWRMEKTGQKVLFTNVMLFF